MALYSVSIWEYGPDFCSSVQGPNAGSLKTGNEFFRQKETAFWSEVQTNNLLGK
jgi:hypothetical protein